MRVAKFVCIGGGLAAIAFFGWAYLTDSHSREEKIATDVKVSAALIEAHQAQKALELLKSHVTQIDPNSDTGKEWLSLLASAYTEMEDTSSLLFLFQRFPSAFDTNEQAAQLIAGRLLQDRQWNDYADLKARWQGKEKDPIQWLFLDSEAQAIQGNYSTAANLLTSRSFTGKEETDRLVRLALLHIVEDPKLSWNYLSEASIKDPDNADLNAFKANLLASVGKHDMALTEYIQAIQKNPQNLFLREQLADVYLQKGNFEPAMEVMEDSLYAPSTDAAWLKALFWSRMASPLKNAWKMSDIPQGPLTPLASYIFALPKNAFWHAATFERTPALAAYLKTRQETFWLRLSEALKKGNETEARLLLEQNPFQPVSWAPTIENALKATLDYRSARFSDANEPLPPPKSKIIPKSTLDEGEADIAMQLSKQQFKDTLQELYEAQKQGGTPPAVPQDIDQLLLSKEAFAAIFLAYDWQEAALQLHKLHIITPTFPDWVVYYLTLAMNNNRDSKTALHFASPQKATPETSLLIAHLAQSLGLAKTAQEELATVYQRDDKLGYLAAQQLSKLYLEQNNVKAAKETILAQPLLANDVRGKEMLARIAIMEGNPDMATAFYTDIVEESPEAKSFLMRKAYTDKDWAKARQLAEELLAQHPDSQQLQENLQRIILEQRRTQTGS